MSMSESCMLQNGRVVENRPQDSRWGAHLVPLGQGVVLAAAYGLVFGIGTEGGHVLGFACAVPLTFTASMAVAMPSLYVVLSMLEAPLSLGSLLHAVAGAFRHSALALGGLSPSLLLFAVSVRDTALIWFLGTTGLVLAAILGAYRLISEARLSLLQQAGIPRGRHFVILTAFAALAFEIAGRMWGTFESLLGGGS